MFKLLGSCHFYSYNEKNVRKLGDQLLFLEITEQGIILKSRHTGKSRKLQLRAFSSLSAQFCCEPKTALKNCPLQ